MNSGERTLALLGLGALALWLLRSSANVGGSLDVRFPQGLLAPEDFPEPEQLPEPPLIDPNDYWGGEFLGPSPQVAAFLYMIRRAEHSATDVARNDDYRTFYGGSRFSDMTDHPVNTGEKAPVRLTYAQCRRLGYADGRCFSSAAGAYQFTRGTWNELRTIEPRLPSFGPDDQDLAAVRLLARIGALPRLESGDVRGAIQLASTRWASLPGSTAGQGPKSLDTVIGYFSEGGGTIA